MIETFIRRPVLSLVISLVITLLGALALFTLPVTQFPDIVPPSVVVTAKYTGANAEVCAKAVAIPLERAINGVPGMTYMTSVTSNDGITLVNISFKVGTDPDQAAVNVQNRVTTVLDELPEEVIKAGVTTEKEVNSMLLYLNITSTDSTADEKFVYNFADINVLQELKRIDGVGYVEIMGSREYSMRVWLKPDRMLAYNISADDIVGALRSENVEAAPGKTGESSGRRSQSMQYVLRYTGKFSEPAQYGNIVLRADNDGSVLRLKDVADVEFGALTYSMASKTDGRYSASIELKQRPGSNAREVIQNVKKRMTQLKASSFPPGMDFNFAYDVSRFLDASIHEVIRTFFEAFILVFIVVFLFLQDFRSTLIPALAVPVALVGTLCFMQMLGFSINLLTLFALVLAIGIVVDNAIVVVEAVHVKMTELHMPAMEATIAAMKEITGAIVAITLVMSAVFVPVAFLSGPAGVFYRQFSLTLAISIVISGVNALTLTPALCALLLRHSPKRKRKTLLQRFYALFNRGYNATERKYKAAAGFVAARKGLTLGLLGLFFAATWGMSVILPGGFIPTEDQGMIYVSVTTPPGSTVERTEKALEEIQKTAGKMDAVENVTTLSGYSLVTEVAGSSYGMGMINLKGWGERKQSAGEIIRELEERTSYISDASIEYLLPPTVPGFGNSSGFELRILDKTGSGNLQQTADVTNGFIEALKKNKAIGPAFTDFDPNFPQYLIHVDQDMAAKKGVTIDNAMNTLQTLLGSFYATNFIRFGQLYKVMVQASPGYRTKPEDILNLYVKNAKGEMVPFSTFISLERVFGPEQLTRYNMYNSALITGDAAAGHSSGEAIAAAESLAKEKLPRGFDYEWSGITREQIASGDQAVYIFLICLVFVYLLLAAQYESFLLPLPVILSLPAGIFGAFAGLKLAGLDNNIYAQVALIMLIGLLGKNAILVVEFAILRRKEGHSILQSAVRGAASRLRPILMTSFAFIAGLIPLCIASGAGALGNRSIGISAAAGMLTGTLFGVVLVPGLYVIFATLAEKGKTRKERKLVPLPISLSCLIVVMFVVFSACNVPEKATMPNNQVLPATYAGSVDSVTTDTAPATADTVTVADLPFTRFFSDSNLIRLIDMAIQNNPDRKIALQRVVSARANIRYARAALAPQLNIVASGGVERYGDYTMNGVGNFDTNLSDNISKDQHIPTPTTDVFLGLRSSWEIDVWGKLKLRKKAAFAHYLATERGAQWVTTQLVATVAGLYYDLQAQDDNRAIILRNIELQEKAYAMVQAQKQGGRATELAVQQFKGQLLHTKSFEYEIKQNIVRLETQLNLVLGRMPQPITRSHSILSDSLPEQLRAGIPAGLLTRRGDIQEAEWELFASNANAEAARKAFLPSLTITPYAGVNAFSLPLLFDPGSLVYGLVGGLSAPIINRQQLQADFGVANARQAEALYVYQKGILQAVGEVSANLHAIDNYRSLFQLKEAEALALAAAVINAGELYSTGAANYLEVITAQKGLLDAQLEEINSKRTLLSATVDLYRSLGGGWN